MEKIDQLIDRLDNTKVEISDAIYENIHRGIESIRRQRKKRIFPQISRKVYIRYALTFAILFIIGITYFFSSGVLVRVVQKKGYMVVVRGKGIRERLIDGRIRSFSDRKLETGRDSSILLQYGKHLTVELRGENRIKTGKIKRLFGYERYEFYLSKGDQTYTIVHGDPQLFILTEEVELRHIGTRFNISADMRGTCIKVLEGEVAIKRNIKNKGKIVMFQYEKGSYEKELKSIMNKEVKIKRGEAVGIGRETDKEIERIIDEVISEKKRVNEEIMNRIRRKMVIEKKTEGMSGNWEYDTGSAIWAAPVLYKGDLYFGTEDGYIQSITEGGRLNWRKKAGVSFLNKGIIYNRKYYVIDSKGVLFGININTGNMIWKKQVGQMMYSTPKVGYEKLFIATTSGKLTALDPHTGEVTWKKQLASGIFCEPIIKRDRIYFGSEDGTVCCINWFNSKVEWTIASESRMAVSSPIIDEEKMYVGNNKGILSVIDIGTGKILWKKELGDKILSQPVITGGDLFAVTSGGKIYCMDLKGNIKWELDIREKVETSFVIAEKKMIIPGRKGKVYVIDTRKAGIERIIRVAGEIVSAPVVRGGSIYITTLKGKIYKFPATQVRDRTAIKTLN